ncbi:hypothetical protein [Raineya orbicola]|jgi:hypothetical protein|uniref:Uncharacterized protein n=1 Tax=Raineya orbicola TaxID=2016530 RepID=A0A2N3IG14_9BACT|nr:hypothetical protein [Raineya orbicola]PKQ69264.1 hypothetical protein Rain11_1417 [Raineya orbicola]
MKQILQQLRILHIALTVPIVFMGIVFHFVLLPTIAADSTMQNHLLFQVVVVLMAVGSMAFIKVFMPKLMLNAQKQVDLQSKLQAYKSPFIIKMAILESVAMISLVFYLLTSKLFYVAMAAVWLVLLILEHPTPQNIARELKLSEKEMKDLMRN